MQNEQSIELNIEGINNKLFLTMFTGIEAISRPFLFKLHIFSSKTDLKPTELIGKKVGFNINHGSIRYFHGIISKFYISSMENNKILEYIAEVVPWFWFFNCAVDNNVYQNCTVIEIIENIFKKNNCHNYSLKGLRSTYKKKLYSVQHNETTFNFISRLLEENGICYFFEHYKDKHVLVLSDNNSNFTTIDHSAIYDSSNASFSCINKWAHAFNFKAGKITYNGYDFLHPQKELLCFYESDHNFSFEKKFEIYKFVGENEQDIDLKSMAKLDSELQDVSAESISGESTYFNFSSGKKFKINQTNMIKENTYILTQVQHKMFDPKFYPERHEFDDKNKVYSNSFLCIPSFVTYRPARIAKKPRVHGLQTAIVVGPAEEDIYTDKFGRIKIRFYWDRDGKSRKENSSCWVRYMQTWTGKHWGTLFIPRIGQEVIVSFIDGDPEQPIVVGGLYNFDQMPPFDLPKQKTQSGFKTHSSKNDDMSKGNEFRFEDQDGHEEIYLHAQKDLNVFVEHDKLVEINNNHTVKVKNNKTNTIEEGNDTTTLEKGDSILKVNQGNQETKILSGKKTVEALQSIEFKVGSNSITIDQAGIHLKGIQLNIDGTLVAIESKSSLKLDGSFVEIDATAIVKVQGALVTVN